MKRWPCISNGTTRPHGICTRAIVRPKERRVRRTIAAWIAGTTIPRSVTSLEILDRIEKRYRLPAGYFAAKLPHTGRAPRGRTKLGNMTAAERQRFAWHLPHDFDRRPKQEREEILDWVRRVIISGKTDYRRFQAAALRDRYGLRFTELSLTQLPAHLDRGDDPVQGLDDQEIEPAATASIAPPGLAKEVGEFGGQMDHTGIEPTIQSPAKLAILSHRTTPRSYLGPRIDPIYYRWRWRQAWLPAKIKL